MGCGGNDRGRHFTAPRFGSSPARHRSERGHRERWGPELGGAIEGRARLGARAGVAHELTDAGWEVRDRGGEGRRIQRSHECDAAERVGVIERWSPAPPCARGELRYDARLQAVEDAEESSPISTGAVVVVAQSGVPVELHHHERALPPPDEF